MARLIMLPGLGGSGRNHWHSRWESFEPSAIRLAPASWTTPALADWIAALDGACAEAGEPPVLVAHSMACLLVAHWAQARSAVALGAVLVAPPDEASPHYPPEAASFARAPAVALPFPSLVVASADDPYCPLPVARRLAGQWGAGFIEMGALGHLNAASGLGDWPEGWRLLTAFRAGLGGRQPQGELAPDRW
jgi:uncharacterized protein